MALGDGLGNGSICIGRQLHSMASVVDIKKLDVLLVDDEPAFQDIATFSLEKAGVAEDSIHLAEDGLNALEVLEKVKAGDVNLPILALIDLRMPRMDGKKCAARIRQLQAEGSFCRPIFLVCCSAGLRQISSNPEDEEFDAAVPKPFGTKETTRCFEMLNTWWLEHKSNGVSGGYASGGSTTASAPLAPAGCEDADDVSTMDIIIADSEMMSRMGMQMQLVRLGIEAGCIQEADDAEEAAELVGEVLGLKNPRPLLLFLGPGEWADKILAVCGQHGKPFVACTAVDSAPNKDFVQAVLPLRFQKEDVQDVLNQCRQWWRQQ